MSKTIEQTQQWIERFVIGLNLCPFAKKPYKGNQIRFVPFESDDLSELVELFIEELKVLQDASPKYIETTLIILEKALPDFLEFWDFIALLEKLIEDLKYEGVFQVASFHPNYQFAGTESDEVENFTNRSPLPIIHILREESLSTAIDNYPNTDEIPEKNKMTLQYLGKEGILKLYNKQ